MHATADQAYRRLRTLATPTSNPNNTPPRPGVASPIGAAEHPDAELVSPKCALGVCGAGGGGGGTNGGSASFLVLPPASDGGPGAASIGGLPASGGGGPHMSFVPADSTMHPPGQGVCDAVAPPTQS